VESHYNPSEATSDGAQTIDMDDLEKLVRIGEELYRSRQGWEL
jgi:3-deoxy-D-manno-octulosonic acid (KDO) 8-phosphate synthase